MNEFHKGLVHGSLILLVTLCVSACEFELSTPDSLPVSCTTETDCPSGFDCLEGACIGTTALCGNGVREAGESCDEGTANTSRYSEEPRCNEQCSGYAPHCGDNIVTNEFETCDDGNLTDNDGCPSGEIGVCQTARCGDGILFNGVEECDDGNANSDTEANACRSDCNFGYCGDGVVDDGEACDDGNIFEWDACLSSCTATPCADGSLHPGVCGKPGGFVDASAQHTCAISPDGHLSCWGANTAGELDAPRSRFLLVSVGERHTCGITVDGSISCFGQSDRGQLNVPVGTFTDLSAGAHHACALTEAGTILCWGAGTTNQDCSTSNYACGQAIPPSGSEFKQVSAGAFHTCALDTSGSVTCWGAGQHADANSRVHQGQSSPPTEGEYVMLDSYGNHTCALRDDGEITCWGLYVRTPRPGPFLAMATGSEHSCAISTDNILYCWGLNGNGQMDIPSSAIKDIAVGRAHTCALRLTGELVCAGLNTVGQAQVSQERFTKFAAGDIHTCGLRHDGVVTCWGQEFNGLLNAPSERFVDVVAAGYHNCAKRSDNTWRCWGDIDLGLLEEPPGAFEQIALGYSTACGLRASGSVSCWGWDPYDNLYTTPTEPLVEITSGDFHACGLDASGTIHCWGAGTTNDDCSFAGDFECGQSIAPSGTFTKVVAGDNQTCALATDGSVVCWGQNDLGQATPPTGTFIDLSVENASACGLTSEGNVTCWGTETELSRSGHCLTSISLGSSHLCATRQDGFSDCWLDMTGNGQDKVPLKNVGYIDCPTGLERDCSGHCVLSDYRRWLSDGICDDGEFGASFNCAAFNDDEGDCREPTSSCNGFRDCQSNCITSEDLARRGDGVCDANEELDFNCELMDYDGRDCLPPPPATSCTLSFSALDPTCDTENFGNGYCHPDMNRIECWWDGGDCCASTCGLFGSASCNGTPHCLDPLAAENLTCHNVSCEPSSTLACDGNTAVEYIGTGLCIQDTCYYNELREDCGEDFVCTMGVCLDENDPCAGLDCSVPPTAACNDNAAVSYSGPGMCVVDEGVAACQYPSTEEVCADYAECREGICVAYPDCLVAGLYIGHFAGDAMCLDMVNRAECGWDGGDCCASTCEGDSCGMLDYDCLDPDAIEQDPCYEVTCEEVPPSSCNESNTIVSYEGPGSCGEGTCAFTETLTPCEEAVCTMGTCLSADDPCAGLQCYTPPDPSCVDNTLVSYGSVGTCSLDGDTAACSYTATEAACGTNQICQDGACVTQEPECAYPAWVSDGYCDGSNNSESCGWDGGDCCESTCVNAAYTCGVSGYDCQDPDAS